MKNASRLLALIQILLSASLVSGQNSSIPENVRASYSIDRFGDGIINEMINGIPLPAPKMTGDTYIDEEWKKGRILLYDREKFIDGYAIRYDIDKQELEIQSQQGINVIGGNQIRTFVTLDEDQALSIYVNVKDFKISAEVAFTGFLQILEDGNMALLCGHTIKVRSPDYNEAMHVGNQDYRILKKENFFYIRNGLLDRVPEKKKDFVGIFPQENRKSIQDFIESNRLNTSRGPDLRRIFNYYNAR